MDGFAVVPEAWVGAAKGISQASDVLADGVDAFRLALGGGSPFGSDDLGRALFEGDSGAGASGFVGIRDGLLKDLAWTVNFLRGMAAGLVTSGEVYVEADGTLVDQLRGRRTRGAAVPSPRRGAAGVPESYVLKPVPQEMAVTTPAPPIWKQAVWILEAVGAGCSWPDGDLGGIESWREAARTMARVVGEVADLVGGHARRVSGSGEGAATEAFTSTARRVHGEAGLLESLAARCEHLAQYCEGGADAIVRARWQCLPSALFVVALMRYGAVLGGWAEAAVLPLIRLEGLALRIALGVIRQAALGLVYSAGLDGIGQLVRWDGFHPGELLGALWQGAFAGGLMGVADAGLPALAGRSPALTWLAHAMESPGAGGSATRFVVGGSVGTAAIATAGAVSGHGWDLEHAAETGFGMAFIGTGTELAGKAHQWFRARRSAAASPGGVSRWISPDGVLDNPDRMSPYPLRSKETGTGYDILGEVVAKDGGTVQSADRMPRTELTATPPRDTSTARGVGARQEENTGTVAAVGRPGGDTAEAHNDAEPNTIAAALSGREPADRGGHTGEPAAGERGEGTAVRPDPTWPESTEAARVHPARGEPTQDGSARAEPMPTADPADRPGDPPGPVTRASAENPGTPPPPEYRPPVRDTPTPPTDEPVHHGATNSADPGTPAAELSGKTPSGQDPTGHAPAALSSQPPETPARNHGDPGQLVAHEPPRGQDAISPVPEPHRNRSVAIASHLEIPGFRHVRSGKVREIFEPTIQATGHMDKSNPSGDFLLLLATDRLSAFDRSLNVHLPGKGVIQTAMTQFWLDWMSHLMPNHMLGWRASEIPISAHPFIGRIMKIKTLDMIPIECVARGFLYGSALSEYSKKGTVAGYRLPGNLQSGDMLPEPLFTPSLKMSTGHDMNLTREQAISLLGEGLYEKLRVFTMSAYEFAFNYAEKRGIFIADTKLEFGIDGKEVRLADEVFTPDSSRFWIASEWRPGKAPASLDKRYLREWLMNSSWDGISPNPPIPQSVINKTVESYHSAFQAITGMTIAQWQINAETT
ncbi:phosphoribosylaminoimidazolesuccinocarboxamide synthase [Actinoallomurus sp. CA-142502]|uniref:phosphoribosylaminoimidazolesuccinocarboxamide synthase n=1 Tax=Actinoallomurus sp. CA-142502 TaxID=3239885 RepID=UPI003D8CC0AE